MSQPWGYFTREALRQAWRGRLLTLVAVAALGTAALYGGAWALLWRNAQGWTRSLSGAEQLAVYLRPGLSPQEQELARADAQALSGVASVELVTPQQAAEQLSRDPELKSALDLLGTNPLPPVLKVRLAADSAAEVASASGRLAALDSVDSVDPAEGDVENLLKLSGAASSVLLALMALFSAAGLLLAAAALRLAAWTRREELGIMRLVGAGGGFIRAPFLLEGLGLGLAGGVLGSAALAGLLDWSGFVLRRALGLDLAAFLPLGVDARLALWVVLATGLLGLLGAALALATVRLAYEGEEAW